MMLFKISLSNIRKSIKDYAVYFFTLVLGVAIFYVFNSINSQTIMLDVTSNTYDMIDLMSRMLSGVSIFVAFILGFLIIYASRFLIKRRNTEFAVYMILGMGKRKISLILFFETIIIGIISLIVGLISGIVLSQFMSLLVANMFEANMTKFKFVFSQSACIKTMAYYGIMYVIVMIFNVFVISKCKLINLINSGKKSEKMKIKNSIICTIVFGVAVTALAYSYYMVTRGYTELDDEKQLYSIMAIGAISTFMIFWSLSGILINMFKKMKKTYFKDLNSFVLRQFSSKINTTVFSTTVICLMLFVTICVLSSALSIKRSMTKNLNELAPADIEVVKGCALDDNSQEEEYTKKQIRGLKDSPTDVLLKFDIDLKSQLEDYVEYDIYQFDDIDFRKFLGKTYDTVNKETPFLAFQNLEKFMKISDYNKIAKLYGKKQYKVNNGEYIVIADFQSMISIRNFAMKNGAALTINGETLKPQYKECQEGFIELGASHTNTGIILVSDDLLQEQSKKFEAIVGKYRNKDKDYIEKFEQKFDDMFKSPRMGDYNYFLYETRSDIAESSIGLGAMITFIGLYLGIIFLISSAAILALKELSESSDNRKMYDMLRKIGADEKIINRTLFKQIGIFFLFPLLLAVIHSFFGLKFSMGVLEAFGTDEVITSVIMTSGFVVAIYGGYFFITYLCSKNIIKNQ